MFLSALLFQVIPPGMDFSSVVVQEDTAEPEGELTALISGADGASPRALPPIWTEVYMFIRKKKWS